MDPNVYSYEDAETDSDFEADSNFGANSNSGADFDSGTDSDSRTGFDSGVNSGADPNSGADSGTNSLVDSVADSETKSGRMKSMKNKPKDLEGNHKRLLTTKSYTGLYPIQHSYVATISIKNIVGPVLQSSSRTT